MYTTFSCMHFTFYLVWQTRLLKENLTRKKKKNHVYWHQFLVLIPASSPKTNKNKKHKVRKNLKTPVLCFNLQNQKCYLCSIRAQNNILHVQNQTPGTFIFLSEKLQKRSSFKPFPKITLHEERNLPSARTMTHFQVLSSHMTFFLIQKVKNQIKSNKNRRKNNCLLLFFYKLFAIKTQYNVK